MPLLDTNSILEQHLPRRTSPAACGPRPNCARGTASVSALGTSGVSGFRPRVSPHSPRSAAKPAAANASLQQTCSTLWYTRTTRSDYMKPWRIRPRPHAGIHQFAFRRGAPPHPPSPATSKSDASAATVFFDSTTVSRFLGHARNEEMVGLEEIDDGIWNVLYYQILLGRFDELTRTITGAPSLKNDGWPCPRTKCHLSIR